MVNSARGEVALELDGRRYCLCLTLGALAEIETALGAASLNDLDVKLQSLSTTQLTEIVFALMRGGGEDITLDDLANLPLNMGDLSAAVAKAFAAAGASAP